MPFSYPRDGPFDFASLPFSIHPASRPRRPTGGTTPGAEALVDAGLDEYPDVHSEQQLNADRHIGGRMGGRAELAEQRDVRERNPLQPPEVLTRPSSSSPAAALPLEAAYNPAVLTASNLALADARRAIAARRPRYAHPRTAPHYTPRLTPETDDAATSSDGPIEIHRAPPARASLQNGRARQDAGVQVNV
ncbi:hypothetical protein AURDEDRAFT_172888 [Auricularia subglabra TFB-10046 SS5]|nr:hypothetical protein AURDEDRAFT_172888 [Auricularia subglabra TFB-10046 SS5]